MPGGYFLLTAGVLAVMLAAGCGRPEALDDETAGVPAGMDTLAERYVRLVLALGEHDPNYVDAYHGPAAWRDAAAARPMTPDSIAEAAGTLRAAVAALDVAAAPEIVQLRRQYLLGQLHALQTRARMLEGARLSFDEEAQALYDATPPAYTEAHFQAILDRLDARLPGAGPLIERYERFKQDFVIPPARLDTVFTAAIEEARRRTRAHVTLPPDEHFVVEYVTDKPWSGYNWYQGDAQSLIQVNTDLPIYIDRAVDLAAHEGYPGHHVYNVLLEQHLVDERGWVEFSVYPLFSPQSLIAEGSANYGIEVAFPQAERRAFERDVLFPLAGLDPARVDEYYDVEALVAELSYAGNEAARRYLNGEIDAEAAAQWLNTYALMPIERARQRVRFFDTYRSYVINYNLGQDLVRAYVEGHGGTAEDPEQRWAVFEALLSSPRLPSGLQ